MRLFSLATLLVCLTATSLATCPPEFYGKMPSAKEVSKLLLHSTLTPENEFTIGIGYATGIGTHQDMSEAFRWYLRAAGHGYSTAQSNTALMYYEGCGTAPDAAKAFSWATRAATEGSAPAWNALGAFYLRGIGVKPDRARALFYFRKSADAGYAPAMYNVGVLLADSPDTSGNGEALPWYRRAAKHKVVDAQRALAFAYYRGTGVTRNLKTALQWFRRAAEQGDGQSEMALSVLYSKGDGVPQNADEAERWLDRAHQHGVQAGGL